MEFRQAIRHMASRRMLFLPHAVRQMSRPERMISTADVRKVVDEGVIVEDYPEDVRGHSCLMLGSGEDGRPVHVICAPKDDYLAIVTAYIPYENDWSIDFMTRLGK
jgi:hypothetical protein